MTTGSSIIPRNYRAVGLLLPRKWTARIPRCTATASTPVLSIRPTIRAEVGSRIFTLEFRAAYLADGDCAGRTYSRDIRFRTMTYEPTSCCFLFGTKTIYA